MKDIPLFTTENGIASLGLQEIPYTGRAYIHIRSALDPSGLVDECVGFCRMAGAERVYASGENLTAYPLHTRVLEMRCPRERIPRSDACMFPVTEQTLERWRGIYNAAMKSVPNAAWMSQRGARELLAEGNGYFIHQNGRLLGIGKASNGRISVVAAVERGSGETVMRALCDVMTEDVITLEVADTNEKAMRLYTRMGFLAAKEVSRWYQVYENVKEKHLTK